VTFAVRNDGTMPHEFVVLRTAKPAADLLKGARADEAGNVGETGDMAPGSAKTLHLRLVPGQYALICNLPGHYMASTRTSPSGDGKRGDRLAWPGALCVGEAGTARVESGIAGFYAPGRVHDPDARGARRT
jgi:hypothetical protein